MTCAECQLLLLDLAYGELDAVRAAEVQAHAAGCAACAAELRQITSARAMISPLMASLAEPSAGMDDTILKAARDEASRLHAAAAAAEPRQAAAAGPRIVEVSGSIGLPEAAAPIDVRAPVVARPAGTPARRRWVLRAAIGGSVAAAAALVLVTINPSSTAPQGEARVQVREIAIRAPKSDRPLGGVAGRQLPAASADDGAAKGGLADKDAAPRDSADRKESGEQSQKPESEAKVAAKAEAPARKKLARQGSAAESEESQGADSDEKKPAPMALAPPPPPPPAGIASAPAQPVATPAPAAHASSAARSAPAGAAPSAPATAAVPAESGPQREASSERSRNQLDASASAPRAVASAQPPPQPKSKQLRMAAPPPPEPLSALSGAGAAQGNASSYGQVAQQGSGARLDATRGQSGEEVVNIAAQLEARARTMRMNGSYSEAATLYKQAASLHERASLSGASPQPVSNQAPADGAGTARRDVANQVAGPDKGVATDSAGNDAAMAAAWDLAHAIECLAADARIDEARNVYDDLLSSFPSASGPQGAAQRALRTALPHLPALQNSRPAPPPESAPAH